MSSGLSDWGLTFDEARKLVQAAIAKSLQEYDERLHQTDNYRTKRKEMHLYLTIPTLICIFLHIISAAVGTPSSMTSGLIIAICLLLAIWVVNLVLINAVLNTSKYEISSEIRRILQDYNDWLSSTHHHKHVSSRSINHSTSHPVILGHPHVSLVNCWRNGLWQRIPVVLLATGDIIALTGGDSTPGVVQELLPVNRNSTQSSQSKWKLGSEMAAGQTIRLRRSSKDSSDKSQSNGKSKSPGYAQHSFVKHRALPPDSTELLILSGDIRCFQMAETPATNFVKNIFDKSDFSRKSNKNDVSFFERTDKEEIGKCSGQTYVRKLFTVVMCTAFQKYLPIIVGTYILAVIIRLSIFPSAQTNWALTVVTPIGIIIMCFIPLSLPLLVMASESLVLSDVLATVEASLEESLKFHTDTQKTALAADGSVAEAPLQETIMNVKDTRPFRDSNSDESSSEEDEFLDEDIDEREEEIAEEASKRVTWRRYFQYAIHIFFSRMGWNSEFFIKFLGSNTHFLPLPFIRARFLEMLGAVTMVCFVDDDIICEGYSVTEEIYLLVTGEKDLTAGRKGTILDLHANPEAAGSRFENPLWWKYLPNLKPIALNSMLTYTSSMSTDVLLKAVSKSNASAPIAVTQDQTTPLRDLRQETFINANPISLPGKFKLTETTTQKREPTVMEKELVRHVRKTIPLESLKELAEEIGFLPEDTANFSKLFELNVLAPRLGDAQLLEDYHAWGQEETRRRGTLLAQVRSVIVKDSRGGLQMMSQGDPSLILKYCREFWDGASIAPLNSNDREDILKLYDRYRKEDFDVVCFAYSPIPVALQPLILAAVSRNPDIFSSSADDPKRPIPLSPYTDGDVQCLLFVDPSTAEDLMEANTKQPKAYSSSKKRISQSTKESHRFSNAESPRLTEDVLKPSNSSSSLGNADISRSRSKSGEAHILTNSSAIDNDKPVESEPIDRSTTPPSAHQANDILDAWRSNDQNKTFDSFSPLSLIQPGKISRGITFEMRSHSDSNLAQTLASYPEAIMLTNSESLNCETLIHEMEQLDNHEDLNVLQEDGMTTVSFEQTGQDEHSQSPYLSKRGDNGDLDNETSESISFIDNGMTNISQLATITYLDDMHYMETEILDENMIEEEERPRRHSFDDETVSELMSSSARSKSLERDLDDQISKTLSSDFSRDSPSSSMKAKANNRVHDSSDSLAPSRDISVETQGKNGSQKSLLPSTPSGRLRTKSLDSSQEDDVFVMRNLMQTDKRDSSKGDTTKQTTSVQGTAQEINRYSKSANLFGKGIQQHIMSSLHFKYRDVTSNVVHSSIRKTKRSQSTVLGNRSILPSTSQLQDEQSQKPTIESKKRSLGAQLWPLMRQQVFLGLAASSVPVKPEVPDLLENLNSAGVRFIYFSPRNMKRSKPVAEKIGIQFDWNCAISLRPLGHNDEHDPHRYISSYADWDVQAKLPHGVEAIKKHLQEVDNVPLLVNLYTDATPSTTCEMIGVFKHYGEVVLTIGSSLRSNNQSIIHNSDIGVAIAMLPGSSSHIPSTVDSVLSRIPHHSDVSLAQHDLILTFRLVGLGSVPMLQLPSSAIRRHMQHRQARLSTSSSASNGINISPDTEQLRLASVTESIRKGRLFLLNVLQAFSFLSICTLALAMWPLVSQVIPTTLPPIINPAIILLFLCFYFPLLSLSLIISDTSEGVMKNTPRKSVLKAKVGDESRFRGYLMIRTLFIVFSLFIQGYVTTASTFRPVNNSWYQSMGSIVHLNFARNDASYTNGLRGDAREDLFGFWLVQDVMSSQFLLQCICQAATLLERGQKLSKLPTIIQHPQFYIAVFIILSTHLWVMVVRALTRYSGDSSSSTHSYFKLDWIVWLVMFLLPGIGIFVGVLVNRMDDKSYRRYLQFLRLEFDTKLGMHSPK